MRLLRGYARMCCGVLLMIPVGVMCDGVCVYGSVCVCIEVCASSGYGKESESTSSCRSCVNTRPCALDIKSMHTNANGTIVCVFVFVFVLVFFFLPFLYVCVCVCVCMYVCVRLLCIGTGERSGVRLNVCKAFNNRAHTRE